MSLILIVSILIRLVALGWSIVLLRWFRDWRMGFLAAMLGLMMLRQVLTLWITSESWALVIKGQITEFPGLVVSIMAFLAVFFLERILTESKQREETIKGQNKVFEQLATGASLEEVLSTLVEVAEKDNPGMICSVLLLDKEKKRLLHGAAPNLPNFYNEAINGLEIGPGVGSCGTAAYTGERVIVEDIMAHPYWTEFCEVAKKAGLRACWSEPIVSSTDQILGTFAMYYREPRKPDQSDLEFIKTSAHVAGIAIEKKLAADHIQHLQSVLKAIRNVNQLIVHEKDRQKLLQGVCEILNQTRNYKLVWIGLVEEGTKNVLPAAQAGFEKGYLKSIKITWDDSENGQGPTGTAIKSKIPFVMHDIAGDPRYKPWRDEATKRGYASSVAVPMIYENRVFGSLNVYAALSDAFGEEEIGLLVEVSQDIAFALHIIDLGEKREQAEEELQKRRDENTRLTVIAKERGELQDWINTFDTFVGKYDPDGKGVLFNDAPVKAGGLTRDDVVGKYFPDTKWWSHSEIERARIIECFEKAKAGTASKIETNFRNADGTPVPIIFNCQPVVGDDGKVKYITAEGKIIIDEINLRDALKAEKESLEKRVKERTFELVAVNEKLRAEIAEKKQTQKALAKSAFEWTYAMDFMEDTIYLIDMDDKVIRANKAFYELTGLTQEQTIGQDITSILHPQGEAVSCPVCKARQNRQDTFVTMEANDPVNPTGKPIEVMVKMIRDEMDKPITALLGIHDLTRQRKFEEELRKSQQQLEKRVEERTAELQTANKELESFAYSVSHDLRAPLRAISGFAQIISQRHRASLKEEGRHYFDNIVEASTHMEKLIEDLLKYSQIGRKAVDLVPTPLGSILEMITDTLSEHIAASNAQLDLQANLPVVKGDRTLLTQIFTNLLDNALLYHKLEKPPQIKVISQLDDGHVIISISDKGIGIAPEYYEKIFDIFQRLHDQAEYPGTGIGLAIVKKAVELQKGTVWIESSPDKGSTFNVKLPLGNDV